MFRPAILRYSNEGVLKIANFSIKSDFSCLVDLKVYQIGILLIKNLHQLKSNHKDMILKNQIWKIVVLDCNLVEIVT